jgi:hypothetical protein
MPVGRLAEHRKSSLQLVEREGFDSLDRRRVNRHCGRRVVGRQQTLGNQAPEGVPNHHRLGLEIVGVDQLYVVVHDFVDAHVVQGLGISPCAGDVVAVSGPAGRKRGVTLVAEQLFPGLPRTGVYPQSMDEQDGVGFGYHCGFSLSATSRSAYGTLASG